MPTTPTAPLAARRRLRLGVALVALAHAPLVVACGGAAPKPAATRSHAAHAVRAPDASTRPAPPSARAEDASGARLAAARELDQQGVRAFAEGRFREAQKLFDAAYKRGAPAHELWNMARCAQKLDDLESAADLIERYLEDKSLSAQDREAARRELTDIQRKPSRVLVLSTPPNALVYVASGDRGDRRGLAQGRTPLTLELAPGDHVLTVELAGRGTETERVAARFGRTVVVEVALSR